MISVNIGWNFPLKCFFRITIKDMEDFFFFVYFKMLLLLVTTVIINSSHHQHLYSHTFVHHGSTLSPCHVIPHCKVPPPPHIHPHPPPPPPSPCTAWGRVRTCRLPLIWVRAIQFSGRYKPAMTHAPLHPLTLTCPGHKMCRQPPHGAKGTNTHTSPTPSLSVITFLLAANLALVLFCLIIDWILMTRLALTIYSVQV